MVKAFCWPLGCSGVAQYRLWNPWKYIARLDGWKVKRPPDRVERVNIPVEGKGNLPGIESHTAMSEWADVIHTGYTGDLGTAKIILAYKLATEAGRSKAKIVVDCDDDIFNIDPSNPHYNRWMHPEQYGEPIEVPYGDVNEAKILEHAKRNGLDVVERDGRRIVLPQNVAPQEIVKGVASNCDLLTVSTPRLFELYSGIAKNIAIVPNAIDFELWGGPSENHKRNDGLVHLGQFGANAHGLDWQETTQCLEQLLSEFPNLRLHLNTWVGERKAFQPGTKTEDKLASGAVEYQVPLSLKPFLNHPQVTFWAPSDIHRYADWMKEKGLDIAVAPLRDTSFNRAKSNLKWLEFSALGIPGVYADTESFSAVEHGETGFKAKKHADYYKYLRALIKDAGLRAEIGAKAHEKIKADFNAEKVAKGLSDRLQDLVGA